MRTSPSAAWAVVCAGIAASCGTIDLGDNLVAPDLQLDEDFFHCRIQPEVLTAKSCAGGDAGEEGMCHSARSSLRLVEVMDGPPACSPEGMLLEGPPSDDSVANFEAVRFTVQSDPLSSPFYRRPTGMDSHPRVIFDETDPCAELIVEWINRGAL